MKFRKYSAGQSSSVYYLLEADNWDDYGYRTTFKLSRVENDTPDRIGSVKIAKMGMPKASYNPIRVSDSRPEVPDTFEVLNDSFFSLGQETEYYINLQRYPGEREAVLKALRDIAFDPQIRSEVFQEHVTETSLMRDWNQLTVARQLHRIALGRSEYANYTIPVVFDDDGQDHEGYSSHQVVFNFQYDSLPPTNLQAVIGENGVGKTHLLHTIVDNYFTKVQGLPKHIIAAEDYEDNDMFTNLTVVSASSLDPPFISKSQEDKLEHIHRSEYIHEFSVADFSRDKKCRTPSSSDVNNSFSELVNNAICGSNLNRANWFFIFEHLLEPFRGKLFDSDFDLTIYDFDDTETNESLVSKLQSMYATMSTGQKIVMTILTDISIHMKEQSLLLMDEPESFLHPPLLSSMIRTISSFCTKMNAAVVVATHSPIVIQEIPKQAVKVFERRQTHWIVRGPRIETFGENIGTLTSEVFGIDSTKAGYYRLIKLEVTRGGTLDVIKSRFGGHLGSEALSYLQLLIRERDERPRTI